MIRVAIILGLFALLLLGVWCGLQWLSKSRVRITLRRLPTGREVLWISMALQILKTLLRVLLRR